MNKLIIISGPSGVGKTTIIDKLLEKHPDKLARVLTYTTREPRLEEHETKDEYTFVTVEDFEKMIADNTFLEHDLVYGNYYGKSFKNLESIWQQNKIAIGTIDPLSINKTEFKKDYIVKIFLTVDDVKILRKRLEDRHLSAEIMRKRLDKISIEQSMAKHADFIVKNEQNQIDKTIADCEIIIFANT